MKDWYLAEVVKYAFHRWPIIVAFILVGGLVGAASSIIWPAPYRAVTEIFVGLDVFRAVESRYVGEYANLEFRYPDDYKRWQMTQLNDLVLSEEYLEETLARLRNQDFYWSRVEPIDLLPAISVHWRDPGRWQLVAESDTSEQALYLVETWKDVVLDKTNLAIASSQDLFFLDIKLQILESEQVRISLDIDELYGIKDNLVKLRKDLEKGGDDELLGELQYAELTVLFTQAGICVPDWYQPGHEPLSPDSLTQDGLFWIDQAITLLNRRLENLSNQLDEVRSEQVVLMDQWRLSLHSGRGLAATIIVEDYSEVFTRVSQPRSPGTATLVGGIFGLLVWGIVILVQINHRQKNGLPKIDN